MDDDRNRSIISVDELGHKILPRDSIAGVASIKDAVDSIKTMSFYLKIGPFELRINTTKRQRAWGALGIILAFLMAIATLIICILKPALIIKL